MLEVAGSRNKGKEEKRSLPRTGTKTDGHAAEEEWHNGTPGATRTRKHQAKRAPAKERKP